MKEKMTDIILGMALLILLAWLFYHSSLATIPMLPLLWIFCRWRKKKREEKARQKLRCEFREFLTALSAAIMTGKSVENSLQDIYNEFRELYGENSLVTGELAVMLKKIHYSQPVEEIFVQWGERTKLQEIILFAEVFQTAKRSGGNMVRIIKITSESIQEMLELRQETESYVHGKKMEQNIMQIMPMALILYLNIGSPGFFRGVYGNLFGIVFMSLCLVIYGVAVYVADRMITAALEE